MHHEYFGNDECVDFIRLGLAKNVLAHDRGFDGFNTHVVITVNKVKDKNATIARGGFKTDDDAVAGARKLVKVGMQYLEVITVICKFERPYEFFGIRR